MPIVTIARECGAGGSSVAGLVACALGAEVVDRSLIADVAARAAISEEEVELEDERARPIADRLLRALRPLAAAVGALLDPDPFQDRHALVEGMTRAALREAARTGNVVIVGRGAAAELRDEPRAFHVFLWAPIPDRIRTLRERLDCDEAHARRHLREVDASRAGYVQQVYGLDWRAPDLYDMVLNTGRLGDRGAAAAILGAVSRGRRVRQPALTMISGASG